MALGTVANVSVGKPNASGAVFVAPLTVAVPVDGKAPLAEGFKNLGYVSEDGLTNTVESDSEDIKAWGGDTVLSVQTSRKETFVFTFIESLNEDVLKQVFGEANVVSGTVKHNNVPRGRWGYVFEILLTGGKIKRIVVPQAEITNVGDTVYKDGEAIGYEVTLTAFPDKDGNTAYEYIVAVGA